MTALKLVPKSWQRLTSGFSALFQEGVALGLFNDTKQGNDLHLPVILKEKQGISQYSIQPKPGSVGQVSRLARSVAPALLPQWG